MRKLLFTLCVTLAAVITQTHKAGYTQPDPQVKNEAFNHVQFGAILERFVDDKGHVDYLALLQDRASLDSLNEYIKRLGAVDPAELKGGNDEIVFWINAYNAFTIGSLLNRVPDNSDTITQFMVKDSKGFWTNVRHEAAGALYTLDDIQHKILRTRFKDPRIHFALCNGTLGGPALRRTPYTGAALDEQLEEAQRRFLADATHMAVDVRKNRLQLSPIFNWYRGDFTREAGILEAYVAQYAHDDAERDALTAGGFTIEFLEYDWKLNVR